MSYSCHVNKYVQYVMSHMHFIEYSVITHNCSVLMEDKNCYLKGLLGLFFLDWMWAYHPIRKTRVKKPLITQLLLLWESRGQLVHFILNILSCVDFNSIYSLISVSQALRSGQVKQGPRSAVTRSNTNVPTVINKQRSKSVEAPRKTGTISKSLNVQNNSKNNKVICQIMKAFVYNEVVRSLSDSLKCLSESYFPIMPYKLFYRLLNINDNFIWQ